MAPNTYLSIITLNVNGPNTPIKSHRVPEWIKKKRVSRKTKKLKNFMTTPKTALQIIKGDFLSGKRRPKATKTETMTKQVIKW